MRSGGEVALEAAKATDAEFAKWLVRVVSSLLLDSVLTVFDVESRHRRNKHGGQVQR